MIPQEALKTIPQSEIRTKRIAADPPAGFSFQPSAQFGGIARAVENRHDGKDVILDRKVNTVRLESFQPDFARASANLAKKFRLGLRPFNFLKDFLSKFLSQTRALIFIPNNGLEKFGFRFRLEEGIEIHHQPKRCRNSALTCSKGIPDRGFFSKSARRRSSSADCSGVKSGSYPLPVMSSHKPWAISIRSSSGSAFAAARISDALMALIYRVDPPAQAEFFGRAIRNPQSASSAIALATAEIRNFP